MTKTSQHFLPRLLKKPPFSVEAPGYEPVEGETIPRRNPAAKDKLINTPSPDLHTIFDIIRHQADKLGNAKCMGSRKVIRTHQEMKKIKKVVDGREQEVEKKWTYFELGEYNYMSFIEYEKLILQVGAGFRKLGLQKEDRVHLFAATSAHWLATSHGAVSQSMPIVTAYDTLGEDGLKHSLVQTSAKAIFCEPHLLPVLINPLKEAKEMKIIIYNTSEDVKQENIDKLKSTHEGLTIMSFEELRKLGEDNPVDPVPPSRDDLCCIMYTSGSTGPPKGVPLKHKAVLAAIAGVDVVVGNYIGPGDVLLAYLPLAHILEFVFENACIWWGGTMGYGNPKTLSDVSVRNCKGDIRELKPSVIVGVPAVWESVKKGILGKVAQSPALVQKMFWGALATKEFLLRWGLPGSGVLDSLVFKKIKDATGGRLRIALNGGGPIARGTQRFISMSICPMISGYGLTETSAMGALNDPMAWTSDALGDLPASIEVKLVDFPDAGYFAKNNPPQGEIWIRGDSVTEGYYENEEETRNAITLDGWFKTGDIGEFDHYGHLKIIDRKKNLVKTLNGEYIALEKLESVYRTVPVVANICVYAAEDKARPIAIIVPAEPALKKLAKENGIEGHGIEDLAHNEKLADIIQQQLLAAGKKAGFSTIELIDGIVLADEEWTSQNGMITAAQKIQRKHILKKYQKEIDKAYKRR
ncbi:MAG: long-chain fatty acid-CoA ligase [Cirrosporium novae-zelandiae]|nr:MAG: long-chain fatty acid-CoA ligase [Cirrosporium novae-zelandiae]